MIAMPAHDLYGLTLETVWIPAAGEQAMAYRLTLHNDGATAIDNFRLCFSGPCQVDATATAEGGHIGRRLSTFTELLPPEVGKDYNEQLILRKHIKSPVKTRGAQSARHHTMEEKAR